MSDKQLEHVKDTLIELHRAQQALAVQIQNQCDWNNPYEVTRYHRVRRLLQRTDMLDKFVPSRVCPICKHLRPRNNQWIIVNKHNICCRKCHGQARRISTERKRVDTKIFVEEQVRWVIDPDALVAARVAVNLTQAAFAESCGWSSAHQCHLESGRFKSVSEEKAKRIIDVLRSENLITLDAFVD